MKFAGVRPMITENGERFMMKRDKLQGFGFCIKTRVGNSALYLSR